MPHFRRPMSESFFERPILNSPYDYPSRHWELDDAGQPTQDVVGSRRRADFITPIPKPKKRSGTQQTIVFDEGLGLSTGDQVYDPTSHINPLRKEVDAWRAAPESDWRVTPETARLLKHWRHHEFSGRRPFFCQVEAVETAIWLTEVAPTLGKRGRQFLDQLGRSNEEANPGLDRLALKLATGAGKTTVMSMLIAWQTVNAVRSPRSTKFTRGFLVVAPGITIKDRLRVLQPNDPDAYYKAFEIVPPDMLADVHRARIVITNYHAFKLRERLALSSGGRALLQGRGDELQTLETEGQMLQRVMPELMGIKGVMVLNDEAHHCYREKPGTDLEGPLKGDDKREANDNNEAARLWISGIEAVERTLGVRRVIDLSATPFFLQGSGYAEGTLFPWTMSDFSLMDAIECGIVKLPRVPVADNVPGGEMPKLRELWANIKKGERQLPKAGRGKAKNLDPMDLPVLLQTALTALYGHYEKTFEAWQEAGVGVPPCFIVVCQNTAISKLVYDFVSGHWRDNDDGTSELIRGPFELFQNFDSYDQPLARPNTLLIDSQQLESGEALDKNFRDMASDEIERFPPRDPRADRGHQGGRGDRRPRPVARGHEHGREEGAAGRAGPVRRLGLHVDRGVGRQHGHARPGRPGVRDAALVRAGGRPGAPAVVVRDERGRPVRARVRRRARHPVRLRGQAGHRAAQAAAPVHPRPRLERARATGGPVPACRGVPRRAAARGAGGHVHRRLGPGADARAGRPDEHPELRDHRRDRRPGRQAPGGRPALDGRVPAREPAHADDVARERAAAPNTSVRPAPPRRPPVARRVPGLRRRDGPGPAPVPDAGGHGVREDHERDHPGARGLGADHGPARPVHARGLVPLRQLPHDASSRCGRRPRATSTGPCSTATGRPSSAASPKNTRP